MSTTFFIVPYDPVLFENVDPANYPTSDLSLDPHEYNKWLLSRWPDAAIVASQVWLLPPETPQESGMRVHLQDSLQVVAFAPAPRRRFVDFILWHRGIVAAKYDLYLCHSSAWFEGFLLRPDVTEQDIVEYTGIAS